MNKKLSKNAYHIKPMSTYIRFFSLLILLLAGCAPQQKYIRKDTTKSFVHPLPAVYQADLALKRCPPTSFELVLRPDGLYFLQMQKKSPVKAPIQAEVGAWSYNKEKKTVRLLSYDNAVRVLAITGKQTLKLVKVAGGIWIFDIRIQPLEHTIFCGYPNGYTQNIARNFCELYSLCDILIY
ncbi:MAG: hypothetical protein D3916_06135, partial [Candidatus Electrothrix sp. MAN1_4]|nr:hypothetical protein [Candidatus Electrothrix sp. MAN1_4]